MEEKGGATHSLWRIITCKRRGIQRRHPLVLMTALVVMVLGGNATYGLVLDRLHESRRPPVPHSEVDFMSGVRSLDLRKWCSQEIRGVMDWIGTLTVVQTIAPGADVRILVKLESGLYLDSIDLDSRRRFPLSEIRNLASRGSQASARGIGEGHWVWFSGTFPYADACEIFSTNQDISNRGFTFPFAFSSLDAASK